MDHVGDVEAMGQCTVVEHHQSAVLLQIDRPSLQHRAPRQFCTHAPAHRGGGLAATGEQFGIAAADQVVERREQVAQHENRIDTVTQARGTCGCPTDVQPQPHHGGVADDLSQ